MKIHEKIRTIREERGLTIDDVHDRIVIAYGKNSLSQKTIQRIEKGQISKFSSILKIASALNILVSVLLKDTELEDQLVVKRKRRIDEYAFDDGKIEVISSPSRGFLGVELNLRPSGKTLPQEDPKDGKFEKLVYVVGGELICHLGDKEYMLDYKDTISFDSSIPHYFENRGKIECTAVIIQNPKRY